MAIKDRRRQRQLKAAAAAEAAAIVMLTQASALNSSVAATGADDGTSICSGLRGSCSSRTASPARTQTSSREEAASTASETPVCDDSASVPDSTAPTTVSVPSLAPSTISTHTAMEQKRNRSTLEQSGAVVEPPATRRRVSLPQKKELALVSNTVPWAVRVAEIQRMDSEKRKAAAEEDYSRAKELKIQSDALAASMVSELQQDLKQRSVSSDFDDNDAAVSELRSHIQFLQQRGVRKVVA